MTAALQGDYAHLWEVVRIGYPAKDARTFLARHLGNTVTYELVEGRRGEHLGCVREIEIEPADGGDTIWVRANRRLPDGTAASPFTPDELVEVTPTIYVASGGVLPELGMHDRIVLHVPVRSYLRFLPGVFQGAAPVAEGSGDVPDVDSFRRFLLLFQHITTTVTERIDKIPSMTNPATAGPGLLAWLSSWVGFELDESLPLHQQRELVRRSIRLHRTRGTKVGIEEMVTVLTSAPVRVEERKPPRSAVLGKLTLAGGSSVADRYLRGEPPGFYLTRPEPRRAHCFVLCLESREKFRARFGERAPEILRRIAQIVTREKPAHVSFTIEFDDPRSSA